MLFSRSISSFSLSNVFLRPTRNGILMKYVLIQELFSKLIVVIFFYGPRCQTYLESSSLFQAAYGYHKNSVIPFISILAAGDNYLQIRHSDGDLFLFFIMQRNEVFYFQKMFCTQIDF